MTTRGALLRRELTTRDARAVLLRPAREEDAAALVSLRDAVAAEGEYIAARPGDRSVLEEQASHAALLREGGLAVLAESDGRAVAHLTVNRRSPPNSDTGDLAIIVENSFRDVGLGRAMMTMAIDWARAVALRRISLWVFAGNERAIGLYHALGFADEGRGRTRCGAAAGERECVLMGLRL